MTIEDLFVIPPRTPYFSVCPTGSGTANRESLASVFRGMCEANQLSMRSVLHDVTTERVRSYLALSPSEYPLYAANFGAQITEDVATVLFELSGIAGATGHSFTNWNSRDRARPIVAVDRFHKWCPCCYSADLRENHRVHDRLAWAAQGVELCIRHGVLLETRCEWCGREDFAFIRNRDVAGFCQSCGRWLGGSSRPFPPELDEGARYKWWVARAVADLLACDPPSHCDFHSNIATVISALVKRHFEGGISAAGKFLLRPKSLVSEWRHGSVSPRWDAICQISYAFQVPVRAILLKDLDSVEFSTLQQLPAAIRHERPLRRRRVDIDWEHARRMFAEVEAGHHPTIMRVKHLAERLSVDRTTVARKFPDETKRLEAILSERRLAATAQKVIVRRLSIENAIASASPNLLLEGIGITRRSLALCLADRGISLRHTEAKWALSLARQFAECYR